MCVLVEFYCLVVCLFWCVVDLLCGCVDVGFCEFGDFGDMFGCVVGEECGYCVLVFGVCVDECGVGVVVCM